MSCPSQVAFFRPKIIFCRTISIDRLRSNIRDLKLPTLVDGSSTSITSLCPRRAIPCWQQKRMAENMFLTYSLFSFTVVCLIWRATELLLATVKFYSFHKRTAWWCLEQEWSCEVSVPLFPLACFQSWNPVTVSDWSVPIPKKRHEKQNTASLLSTLTKESYCTN